MTRANSLRPNDVETLYNLGVVHEALGDGPKATEAYGRVLALSPNRIDARLNRGLVHRRLGRSLAALRDLEKVSAVDPDRPFLRSDVAQVRAMLCDWRGRDQEIAAIERDIAAGKPACSPAAAISLLRSASSQKRAMEIHAASKFPVAAMPFASAQQDIVTIGYFSPDFREHPVSHLMIEPIEQHDRAKFRIVGVDLAASAPDAMTDRMRAACDLWIDGRSLSDDQIVANAREIGIDLAVDLAGFTESARPGIFARRIAPVQVGYIGYLGTMGAPFMDYIVADDILIPPGNEANFTEKTIRLPWYQANPSTRPSLPAPLSRHDEGLPDDGFVFCCFNSPFKLSPDIFAAWMRILSSTDNAVLWMTVKDEDARANLRHAATSAGIPPDRLVFAAPTDRPTYFSRLALADLALDTFPYGAGTMASDSVWTGLPTVTMSGDTFASRMCASVLAACGVEDTVATTIEDYEKIALTLAKDPAAMTALRHRIVSSKHQSGLFSPKQFVSYLGRAYEQAIQRAQTGLSFDHIRISDQK